MTGVGYILLDEHSMLDCRALCAISARCCEAMGVFERPFGGLNVILSGDFAQLPPVTGQTLNRDKDQINATNSARFAAENGQVLEDFYSFDKLSSGEPKRQDPKKARRVLHK
ncbi:hypothetical protein DFP72DRAFT_880019 [Ephemerocybe angulata]|uniref:ATP-dependent DNA helicase n=1 Tax=Ephemerocybe angulata TaxID=980116 RepID=A0A8H6IC19_9AGAR|nr:hypothetical protein DFP72DRAFT_880019 [Tulosesus angulatus]